MGFGFRHPQDKYAAGGAPGLGAAPLSRNGKGIDHLTEADFVAFEEELLPGAFELCSA